MHYNTENILTSDFANVLPMFCQRESVIENENVEMRENATISDQ